MASLVCFTRGDRRVVNQFLDELQAKYLEFEYEDWDKKEGKFISGTKVKYQIPISVRYLPLGAWEIVYPREKRDLVLTTVLGKPSPGDDKYWSWLNKYLFPIRVAMRLEKLKPYDSSHFFPIFKQGIHIIPVGEKDDHILEQGVENL